ncbi:MAG TPA: HAD family hydrolase [Candidatus Eisenbacteria bacterium]|nr:HAD family hydrolase [Candidatus Eisenbacteria bacterium]
MLRAVIFDYGNTLIGIDPATPSARTDYADVVARPGAERLAAYLEAQSLLGAGGAAERARFAERFLEIREANRNAAEVNGDEITAEASLAEALAAVGAPAASAAALREAVAIHFSAEEERIVALDGAVETLRTLRAAGVRIGLLSNATDGRYVERVAVGLGMRPYFDPFVVSADIGVRKPRAEAFHAVLDRWPLPPGEVAMVGDSLYHDVGGANRLGLRSIHYTQFANPFDPPHAGAIAPWGVAASHDALRRLLAPHLIPAR